MAITEADVQTRLRALIDPNTGKDFVSGGGDRVKVDFVEPMGQRRTLLCPKGEAGSIEVSFTARGENHRSTQPAYFECDGSYLIQIDVSPEFEARSAVRLR